MAGTSLPMRVFAGHERIVAAPGAMFDTVVVALTVDVAVSLP